MRIYSFDLGQESSMSGVPVCHYRWFINLKIMKKLLLSSCLFLLALFLASNLNLFNHNEISTSINNNSKEQENTNEHIATRQVLTEKYTYEDYQIEKYQADLNQWNEWNNECMGMDPNSKPIDPHIK